MVLLFLLIIMGTYIDFLNNIKSGYINTKTFKIKISNSEFNGKTTSIELYYKDDTNSINLIDPNAEYIVEGEKFLFYSGILSGEYKYSYSIYITAGENIVVSCFLNIIISCSNSFPNCIECEYIEDKGESCKSCDIDNEYYPLTDDNGITKCYQNETTLVGYYLNSINNKFEKCHEGCIKCYESSNNNCLNDNTCTNNVCCNYVGLYYPIKNQGDSCYKNETRPDGYYLDSINNRYDVCHEGCIKCYGSSNNNCLNDNTCSKNVCCNYVGLYYPVKDQGDSCYKNESRPNGYYLTSGTNSQFEKCHEGCIKCYGSTNNNCLNDNTCSKNVCCNYVGLYYPIKDQGDSCYKNETRPDGYYLDSINNRYDVCHEGCIKCYGSTNKNCLNDNSCTGDNCCSTSYYPIFDQQNECYKNDISKPDYYYLDLTSLPYLFKRCNNACLRCVGPSETECENSKCNEAQFYYPLNDLLTSCYKNESRPNHYYLMNDKYYNCYEGCLTCDSISTNENPICLTCDSTLSNPYYPLKVGTTIYCYQNGNQPEGYSLNTNNEFVGCYETCHTCHGNGDEDNNNCISCKVDQYYQSPIQINNCVSSSTLFNHFFFNDTSKAFESCPSECLTCSKESLSDNNKCITCMSNYIYHTLIEGKC